MTHNESLTVERGLTLPAGHMTITPEDLRYELKLAFSEHLVSQARSWIGLHPAGFGMAYRPRRVNSLYLDTLDYSSLQDSLLGACTRAKLRIRWYGDVAAIPEASLEYKLKRGLLGCKIISAIPFEISLTAAWPETLAQLRTSADPDWRLLLQRWSHPALVTSYRREYYSTMDGAVRVTLDYDQVAFDQRLSDRPNTTASLPLQGRTVIEIKADRDQAERLPEVLNWFPVARARNSKYVRGLLAALGS
jgi:hypothetical protein